MKNVIVSKQRSATKEEHTVTQEMVSWKVVIGHQVLVHAQFLHKTNKQFQIVKQRKLLH